MRYADYVYPLGEGVKGEWPEAPAETLRRAAALIRERASAVPVEGLADWWFDADAPDLMHLHRRDREQIATFGHPTVALAVAEWLDEFDGVDSQFIRGDHPALKVARAYLGNEAASATRSSTCGRCGESPDFITSSGTVVHNDCKGGPRA